MDRKSRPTRAVLVRTTHEQYMQLAQQAEAAGISINALCLNKLGCTVKCDGNGDRRGRRPKKLAITKRVMLRMSPEEHANLVRLAETSRLSLNSLILSLIGLAIPFKQCGLSTGSKMRPTHC